MTTTHHLSPFLAYAPAELHALIAGFGVHVARRFIGESDAGFVYHGLRDGPPLLLTS